MSIKINGKEYESLQDYANQQKEKTAQKYTLPKGFTVKFSRKSGVLLDNLKGFDKQEFLNWMFNDFVIGNSTILEYLIYKEIQKIKEVEKKKE